MNLSWRALPISALLILFAGSAAAVDGGGLGSTGLGVRVIPTTQQLREALGVGADEGALVMEVTRGSPAHRAGLRAGDVLTRIGPTPVGDARDVVAALAGSTPDRAVELHFVRGRIALGVRATVGAERPHRLFAASRSPGPRHDPSIGAPRCRGATLAGGTTPDRARGATACGRRLDRRLRQLEERLRRLEDAGEPQSALEPSDRAA